MSIAFASARKLSGSKLESRKGVKNRPAENPPRIKIIRRPVSTTVVPICKLFIRSFEKLIGSGAELRLFFKIKDLDLAA
jgi:hypothetical protein